MSDELKSKPNNAELSPSLEVPSSLSTHHSSLSTHSIRLRGAWITEADGERTRHSRNFGRPRTLDANEELWLVCGHIPGPASVLLNDVLLATTSEPGLFAANITASLLQRNHVVFAVASAEPLGEVLLEVRQSNE